MEGNAVGRGTGGRRRRVFYALWPDAKVRAGLVRTARSVQREVKGRLTAPANLHLTLAFVGAVGAERLQTLLAPPADLAAGAFVLRLDQWGCWARQGIVWAAPSQLPPALAALAKNLERWLRAAGFALEVRAFSPHLTLIRRAHCAQAIESMAPLVWRVSAFSLVESQPMPGGSVYRTLDVWPLTPQSSGCLGHLQR